MTQTDAALVDELASEIQSRVLSGAIPTGARLRQESLAAEFGVSRTPVREALRKLQASGLVEMLPRRGALVRGPSAREVREAYEVRAELEGLAASLAATCIRDDELRRLRTAQSHFRRSVASLLAWRRSRGDQPLSDAVEAHAEWIEGNELFPNRTNVSFLAIDGSRVRARIFERGVGETLSSGTGASGAAIAAFLRGTDSPIVVELEGGELEVEIGEDLAVRLTGWAEPVCSGELSPELLTALSELDD